MASIFAGLRLELELVTGFSLFLEGSATVYNWITVSENIKGAVTGYGGLYNAHMGIILVI
jgi:hypothetical protein